MQSNLAALSTGQCGTISTLEVQGSKRRRLMELGFIPGAAVTALQKAPFGGVAAYEIMGTVIALRPEDARQIQICSA